MEMAAGEEFAVQVLNLEGNHNLLSGSEDHMGVLGGHAMAEGGSSGGLEYILQSAGIGAGHFWNTAGTFQSNVATAMGVSMGPFISGPVDPLLQFNSCQEWSNLNTWGSSTVPFDAGTNVVVCGTQLMENEQRGGQSEYIGARMIMAETLPSPKGKKIAMEESGKKGRRAPVAGRGKARAIQAGHKKAPKTIWIKRGGGEVEAEHVGPEIEF